MKEWIFWRHAHASDAGHGDLLRPLSDKGHKQATRSANWLRQELPDENVVFTLLCSEALRSRQTAAAYAQPDIGISALNPGTRALDVVHYLNDITEKKLIIVGHQPWIGQIISYLLEENMNYLEVGNSDLLWLRCQNEVWQLHKKHLNGNN